MLKRAFVLLVIVAVIVGYNNYRERGSALSFPPREGQAQAVGGEPVSGGGITIEPTEPGELVPPPAEWQPAIRINSGNTFAWRNGDGAEVNVLFTVENGQPGIQPQGGGEWQMEWSAEVNAYVVTRDGAPAFFVINRRDGGYSIGRDDHGSTFRIVR